MPVTHFTLQRYCFFLKYARKKNIFSFFYFSPITSSPLAYSLLPIARLRASYNLTTSKVLTFSLSYGRYTLT